MDATRTVYRRPHGNRALEQEGVAALDPADCAKAQELKDEYDGKRQDLQELCGAWEELAG